MRRFTLAILLLAVCPVLRAQSTFGSVLGTVVDASGAVVAGANVTLRNLDEGVNAAASFGPQGYYQFENLQPGRYQVSAERPGFATQTTPEFTLEARETRRADFRLDVASRSDAVTVTAPVPVIDTENGTIADSKSSEEIAKLPLNYRAEGNAPINNNGSDGINVLLLLLSTVPGAQQDTNARPRLSLGGGLPGQVEVSIDGISAVDVQSNLPNAAMTPSAETLGELRVTSAGAPAEFGQMGDVAMITRAGTNQLHGGIFWYLQNRALDATPYGLPKPQKVFNDFGGKLGGPVELPGLYHGKNRTFFFADYEGIREPQTLGEQLSVPSASMRTGDLTGVPGGPAVDPLNGEPFPNNSIPLTRISSVSRSLLANYYPLPNVQDPNAVYNYVGSANSTFNQDGYDLRLDHVINSKQHLFGRWSSKQDAQQFPFYYPDPNGVEHDFYQSFVVSHTFTPSAALTNEARFGFSRTRTINDYAVTGKDVVATLGLTGLNLSNVGNSGGFPVFDFSDGTGFSTIGSYGRTPDFVSRTFQYADTLSWIHGPHTAKFGAETRRVGYHSTLYQGCGGDFGCFYFYSNNFSGNAYADFLLGLPAESDYAALGPNIDESSTAASFFAQDSWRVNSRLTINYGLRWEVHPPFQEASGNIANFDQQTGAVIVPDHTLPAAPGFLQAINACPVATTQPCTPILTASQVGLGEGLRKTYYGDWDPRFGFAWQPWGDGKTVIRGAIGRYTETLLGQLAYANAGIASSDIRTFDQGPNLPPLFTFPAVSPPLSSPAGLGIPGTENFQSGVDPTLKDPYSYQWNFTVERALPWSTSLRASYIGLQSVGMPALVDYNQVPASSLPFSASRQPFPQWNLLNSAENIGFSNYQSMQVELWHRLRNGIALQASYTLAKDLGEVGMPNGAYPLELPSPTITDRFDPRYDRGNLGGSRRNRFLLTGLFPLPFARNRILGGWELSTVTMIESGPYQTPIISPSLDRSNTNLANRYVNARPDRIGNGNLSNPTPQMYYDKSAFVAVPKGAGRFGNAGAGILEGPGTVAISAGLGKTFRLMEKLHLRTEATFTNLPNHPNFQPPVVNISSPAFGQLTRVQPAENAGNRTGQLSARLEF